MLYLSENAQLSIPRNGLVGTETFSLIFRRYSGAEFTLSGLVPFFVGVNDLRFNLTDISSFADGQYRFTATTEGYSYSEDLLVELDRKAFGIIPSDVSFDFISPTFIEATSSFSSAFSNAFDI